MDKKHNFVIPCRRDRRVERAVYSFLAGGFAFFCASSSRVFTDIANILRASSWVEIGEGSGCLRLSIIWLMQTFLRFLGLLRLVAQIHFIQHPATLLRICRHRHLLFRLGLGLLHGTGV